MSPLIGPINLSELAPNDAPPTGDGTGSALCKVARAYVDDLHSEPPKPARSRDEMVGASTEAVIAIRRGYGYHSAPQGIAEAVLIAAGAIAREDDDDA